MPPIRRYLRISKYSVLECRIFVEDPADAQRWLLNPRDPVLPRVIESVKPLILPKLREENDRARGKGKKKKTVKDVVTEDDFEVSIFLREIGTRHSVLTKNKTFRDKGKITSNSNKLTGGEQGPLIIREESDDEAVDLHDIPSVHQRGVGDRFKGTTSRSTIELDLDDAASDENQDSPDPSNEPHSPAGAEDEAVDEKKKMGLKTSYEGFSIWGWVLCLIVKRKGGSSRRGNLQSGETGQVLMEEWIASTQQPQDEDD